MPELFLDIRDDLTSIGLIPAPVQLLSGEAQLDDKVAGEVFWLGLSAFLPPKAEEGDLIVTHDDPSVRTPYKETAIRTITVKFPKMD
jgi:hypothetical protein